MGKLQKPSNNFNILSSESFVTDSYMFCCKFMPSSAVHPHCLLPKITYEFLLKLKKGVKTTLVLLFLTPDYYVLLFSFLAICFPCILNLLVDYNIMHYILFLYACLHCYFPSYLQRIFLFDSWFMYYQIQFVSVYYVQVLDVHTHQVLCQLAASRYVLAVNFMSIQSLLFVIYEMCTCICVTLVSPYCTSWLD